MATGGARPDGDRDSVSFGFMALVRFLDGKQRGNTTTVDDARIVTEGRYRFKKREIAKTGGRAYYLKAVPRKRWIDRKVPEWTAALDDDRAD